MLLLRLHDNLPMICIHSRSSSLSRVVCLFSSHFFSSSNTALTKFAPGDISQCNCGTKYSVTSRPTGGTFEYVCWKGSYIRSTCGVVICGCQLSLHSMNRHRWVLHQRYGSPMVLVLWLMLSFAHTAKSPDLRSGGHTTF